MPAYASGARRVVVLALTAAAYLALGLLLRWSTAGLVGQVRAPGPAPLDAQIGVAAAAGGWLVLTWLGTSTVLAVAAVATGGTRPRLQRLAERVSPALVRRGAATLLGAGIAGGSLTGVLPAYAEEIGRPAPRATAAPLLTDAIPSLDRPADLLPGWTPDRPSPRRRAARPSGVHLVATLPPAGRAVVEEVVVRRGDTLWDLVARHLGPDATAVEIAHEWPRWHRANREVIGPEPDHILPGQRLRPPVAARHH